MAKDMDSGRRVRGELEADIKRITDAYTAGDFTVEGGRPLTPHRIAKAIKDDQSLEAAPSAGAVTATLKRWEEIGFATLGEGPISFTGYTNEGQTQGLAAMKAARSPRANSAAASGTNGSSDGSGSSSPPEGTGVTQDQPVGLTSGDAGWDDGLGTPGSSETYPTP